VREQPEQLLERVAIGIAQIDPNGGYLLASERYCEMLGRDQQEVLRAELQDFVYHEDLPTALDGFIRVLETGEPGTIDHRVRRGDGSMIWLGNTVSAARNTYGRPEYLLILAQDVTTRKETERALARSQADLRMMIDSTAEGIYCIDRNGSLTLCNAAFRRMLGFEREEEIVGKDIHGLIHHSYPDGSHYPKIDCPVYQTVQSGIHAHVPDGLFYRRDGTRLPVEFWVRPIIREGEIEGAVCTFVDITERMHAEAQLLLVTHEIGHRLKNTLAMVQAIVGQSLRNSPAAQEVGRSITQRLIALGHAHTVLTRTRWGNASIIEVVEGAVAVHRSRTPRIQAVGPNLEIGSKAALGITLALHELCTNAAKYGALSVNSGRVTIEWAITGGAADARFHISWTESGGPPVAPPTHRGFGSRLIAEGVGPDLKGQATLVFDPDGVIWNLDAPLNAVRE
jgi:PAS domain S-box-containing protein